MKKTYKGKRHEVEAVQWTGDNLSEVTAFTGPSSWWDAGRGVLVVSTPLGLRIDAAVGDYIVHALTSLGGFNPLGQSAFQSLYEEGAK